MWWEALGAQLVSCSIRSGLIAQIMVQPDRNDSAGRVMFTSLFGISARRYVSRHPFNPTRRQRASEDARGIQARNRRELQRAILYHQLGREECQSLSHAGLGR